MLREPTIASSRTRDGGASSGDASHPVLNSALIHAVARVTIAFVWLWHGLVPKLLFHDADEVQMLAQAGVADRWLSWIGLAEIAMAFAVLATWRWRGMFVAQAALMAAALVAVAVQSPAYMTHAFNPVTLNMQVIALAVVGWLSQRRVLSAQQ